MLTGLSLGCLWFAAFLVSHAALFHFRKVQRRFQALVGLFLGAAVGHLVTGAFLSTALGALNGVVLLGCLFVVYMPFYYTISASVSVRTLVALHRSPGERQSLTHLVDRFASLLIVQGRLGTLAANAYVVREGDVYRLTGKGRIVAHTFRRIKALWKLGPGG